MTWNFKFVNGDVVKVNGQLQRVEQLEKAEQLLGRMLMLDAPQGAGIDAYSGSVPISPQIARAEIARLIEFAFTRTASAQQSVQAALRTPEETWRRLARLEVNQRPNTDQPSGSPVTVNPTKYRITVQVQTGSSNLVAVAGSLVPPGTPQLPVLTTGRGRRVTVTV